MYSVYGGRDQNSVSLTIQIVSSGRLIPEENSGDDVIYPCRNAWFQLEPEYPLGTNGLLSGYFSMDH